MWRFLHLKQGVSFISKCSFLCMSQNRKYQYIQKGYYSAPCFQYSILRFYGFCLDYLPSV